MRGIGARDGRDAGKNQIGSERSTMMGTGQILAEITALLWVGALAATPLALLVGGMCRWKNLRPATRHMLWVVVLASFVTPAIGSWIWRPEWFRTDRLVAATTTEATPA